MKRIGYIYEKIYDIENIKAAIRNAARGKKRKHYVRRILQNADFYAAEIHKMLKAKSFTPGPNRCKTIRDGASQKERRITVPQFYPDQIIHRAAVQVLEPLFMRGMYRYCCGSVPGRGGMAAKKYVEKVMHKKKAKYTAKLDITKFFASVSHAKLKALLAKKIKDRDALGLLGTIIDHGGEGLPIGYYTSQWLSNFYLQEADHYIKEELHVPYYVRYVDDMVLMGPNKRKLRRAVKELAEYFECEGFALLLKGNAQTWRSFSRPLDFVGYRFYESYVLLRKKLFYRLMRAARIAESKGLNLPRAQRLISLAGWASHIRFDGKFAEKQVRAAKTYISKIRRKEAAA